MVKYLTKHRYAGELDYREAIVGASHEGHLHIIKYMVESGIGKETYGYAACRAAAFSYNEMLIYLIDCGADIHDENNSVLISVASNGNMEMMERLYASGKFVYAEYLRALNFACCNAKFDIANFLIERNINILDTDDALRLALICCRSGSVKFLIEHGVSVNQIDCIDLCIALMNGYVATVKYLIEQGANITDNGEHLLSCAVTHADLDFLKYIISIGCKGYDNALQLCIEYNKFDMAYYLIEQGADVHAYSYTVGRLNNRELLDFLANVGARYFIR
jgi:ankyrin repeat protein